MRVELALKLWGCQIRLDWPIPISANLNLAQCDEALMCRFLTVPH